MPKTGFKAVFSSDWSECLSPNGPFDPISFNYPELQEELTRIFKQYTGNVITLKKAVESIHGLLPGGLTIEQMDAYLESSFSTYTGVPELIEWCLERGILFMINTTGTQGYFQRAFAKDLLPKVSVVAANPFISFPRENGEVNYGHHVLEIDDKAKNTEAVVAEFNISPKKVIVMGDSGGDGPHFKWGASVGAYLIGSMTKASLAEYCRTREIRINKRFGLVYASREKRDPEMEMEANFMDLTNLIEDVLDL
jgi:2-hydroxy-3-keto-5-methylthiopentenyl-1-phosphate phosphatase